MQQDSFDARLQGQKPESIAKAKTGKGKSKRSLKKKMRKLPRSKKLSLLVAKRYRTIQKMSLQ